MLKWAKTGISAYFKWILIEQHGRDMSVFPEIRFLRMTKYRFEEMDKKYEELKKKKACGVSDSDLLSSLYSIGQKGFHF
jgi:hypothetical protein